MEKKKMETIGLTFMMFACFVMFGNYNRFIAMVLMIVGAGLVVYSLGD